jgi:predicted dienelactone hydrolase
MRPWFTLAFALFWVVAQVQNPLQALEYDPLRVDPSLEIKTVDLTVSDESRSREIPLRVYLPPSSETPKTSSPKSSPIILFSHGLGGSKEGSPFLGKHWAKRGYIAVFMQHPGSDEGVWKGEPFLKRMAALKEAASAQNFSLRVQDVKATIDQLAKWNDDNQHALGGKCDLKHVGMSGHSFGAQTTQAVSGQNFDLIGTRQTDPRIKAAVIMSPGPPRLGSPEKAFGGVKIPWLLMTGTLDDSPIGNQTPESRRKVYPALPIGAKFELVLNKAEHSAFTERALPGERQQRNSNHHRAILALSTAFWDAYLKDDASAQEWLTTEKARGVLEASDVWQQK